MGKLSSEKEFDEFLCIDTEENDNICDITANNTESENNVYQATYYRDLVTLAAGLEECFFMAIQDIIAGLQV